MKQNKIKKFISKKGGLLAFLTGLGLVLIASFLIIVGVIYGTYGGNWNKIPEVLSSDFAIAVYIIIGLTILALFYITIISNRKKEIK